jgi:hypothetical protein
MYGSRPVLNAASSALGQLQDRFRTPIPLQKKLPSTGEIDVPVFPHEATPSFVTTWTEAFPFFAIGGARPVTERRGQMPFADLPQFDD